MLLIWEKTSHLQPVSWFLLTVCNAHASQSKPPHHADENQMVMEHLSLWEVSKDETNTSRLLRCSGCTEPSLGPWHREDPWLWAGWFWVAEDSPAVPQAAHWGCAIFILRGFPDPTGSSPERPGLTPELTSFVQVGQGPPEVTSSLNGCVMLHIYYLVSLTGDGQNLKPSHWNDSDEVWYLQLMGWLLQKSCKLPCNLQQCFPVQIATPSCPKCWLSPSWDKKTIEWVRFFPQFLFFYKHLWRENWMGAAD